MRQLRSKMIFYAPLSRKQVSLCSFSHGLVLKRKYAKYLKEGHTSELCRIPIALETSASRTISARRDRVCLQ